jgi:hyperosmotically inducible protein
MLVKLSAAIFVSASSFLATVSAAAPQHEDAFTRGQDYSAIAQRVRQALLLLPNYGVFDDLAFRVDGTTITLLGAVVQVKLKSDAEIAAKHVEGATHVVNEIEVLPASDEDDAIRAAAFRAIYQEGPLAPRYSHRAVASIHIIVKNKDVRLEGVVDNQADRDLAGARANVKNAYKVTNDLTIAR